MVLHYMYANEWRRRREVSVEISKKCLECRIVSEYVYPIKKWIDDKKEKEQYLNSKGLKFKKQIVNT